jgi:hypothetical protein
LIFHRWLIFLLVVAPSGLALMASEDFVFGALWTFEHEGSPHYAMRLASIDSDGVNSYQPLLCWGEEAGQMRAVSIPQNTEEVLVIKGFLATVPGRSEAGRVIEKYSSLYERLRYIVSNVEEQSLLGYVGQGNLYVAQVNCNGDDLVSALQLLAGIPLVDPPSTLKASQKDYRYYAMTLKNAMASAGEVHLDPMRSTLLSCLSMQLKKNQSDGRKTRIDSLGTSEALISTRIDSFHTLENAIIARIDSFYALSDTLGAAVCTVESHMGLFNQELAPNFRYDSAWKYQNSLIMGIAFLGIAFVLYRLKVEVEAKMKTLESDLLNHEAKMKSEAAKVADKTLRSIK